MKHSELKKFTNWLLGRGAEILPLTNEYEALRFKGKEVGVIYKTGKTSGSYATKAIKCYIKNKKWDGGPVNVGRKSNYKKEKIELLKRDGRHCFYCGLPLEDDISLEHLISLSSGGKNTISNMVLCHEKCNQEVKNLPISKKVKFAIKNRMKYLSKIE